MILLSFFMITAMFAENPVTKDNQKQISTITTNDCNQVVNSIATTETTTDISDELKAVFDSSGNKCDETFFVNMTPQEYDYYPYLDIMRFYKAQTGYLTNDRKIAKYEDNFIILDNELGSFSW